jgi:hypothetical protein
MWSSYETCNSREMKIHIVALWVMAPCSLVDRSPNFGGKYLIHLQCRMVLLCVVNQTTTILAKVSDQIPALDL